MALKIKKHQIETFLRNHAHIDDQHLFSVGKAVGEWRLTAFISKGGSGEIYRAKHSKLDISVAIKILFREDEQARSRFRREAQIFAENQSLVFPRFYGYGEVEGYPYMVIELLEYLPLPNTDHEVARYLLKVCEGLEYLHTLGLVHRDIKPQNILQRGSSGRPVLIDLGLVKDVTLPVAHQGESLSIVGGKAIVVGTPRYSAPEQFAGGEISPAADIHALGMLANDCFGGNPPLVWSRIIRRSTSSIPTQRYHTVRDFASAIRQRYWRDVVIAVLGLVLLAIMLVGYLGHATILPVMESRQLPSVGVDSPLVPLTVSPSTNRVIRTQGLHQGLTFVPDTDSDKESTSTIKPKNRRGVFSGDKEINLDF